ncbi:hypothetical protein BT93_F0119 [Corymbia citriodora subsp. variegata]|nr:hypothetical protein BT93_F0119 [Corymbia citriodora subsp. variegata]
MMDDQMTTHPTPPVESTWTSMEMGAATSRGGEARRRRHFGQKIWRARIHSSIVIPNKEPLSLSIATHVPGAIPFDLTRLIMECALLLHTILMMMMMLMLMIMLVVIAASCDCRAIAA